MNSTVSEKGQVTIPKVLRDGLGLTSGTVLKFFEQDGRLVATKVQESSAIHRWRGKGSLPAGRTVDEYLSKVRGR